MSFDIETLYALLPAVYRLRDAEQGEPLKALLSIIAGQIAIVEEDLAQLYDDLFIETCAQWVVPYIGDLIGYRQLYGVAPQVRSPRAEVANTIGYRRRKGTAVMLEQLARDVTGWNARAVEFFQLLATTQYMNHLRPQNLSLSDVHHWEPLERLNTAFDRMAHTADVHRIASGRGRYNIPNIGIFLWRLGSYAQTSSPAFKLDERRYLFSPLGNNTQLFSLPQTESELTHLSEPINVPMPLSRRVLDQYLTSYYGPNKSLVLNVDGQDIIAPPDQQLSDLLQVCDLSDPNAAGDQAHKAPWKIAIDPVLGRIAFPEERDPPTNVLVTYYYGFSANIGGGSYDREGSFEPDLTPIVQVSTQHRDQPGIYSSIQEALNALHNGGVVEIIDSGRYTEALSINVAANTHLEIRAAEGSRPTLVLGNDLAIQGENDSICILNGLLISGRGLQVAGGLAFLKLRHCTIVPGLTLSIDGTPQHPSEAALEVSSVNTAVEIDACILGGLRIAEDDSEQAVSIIMSIIDSTGENEVAYAALDGTSTGRRLHIENSTVIGKVYTALLDYASNTIFLAPILSTRKQKGCVRFSYVPLDARVPRRYHCQPVSSADAARVRPQFTSLRYGEPGYCQLSLRCANEIRRGADDESEMGAFHNLYQPQKETNLRVRLDEYLRFGLEAGIFYAT